MCPTVAPHADALARIFSTVFIDHSAKKLHASKVQAELPINTQTLVLFTDTTTSMLSANRVCIHKGDKCVIVASACS